VEVEKKSRQLGLCLCYGLTSLKRNFLSVVSFFFLKRNGITCWLTLNIYMIMFIE